MEVIDWNKKELEKLYVNVFILEEEVYVRKSEQIKKQKMYIFIGLNLKGYKEIIGLYTPEEENTSYWLRSFSDLKKRGVEEIFMVSMINNKWLKKVFKMHYPKTIYAPSLIEFYNKTHQYIARKQHRVIMREIGRIYRAKEKEEAQLIYNQLKKDYENNKLLIMIINKYIDEIFSMFRYSHQARKITSNTDSYNKMRNRIRWKLKKITLFDSMGELQLKALMILKEEEMKWHPSYKKWDQIVNEMDCELAKIIYELI